ncbi:hypothetical protein Theam_1821 (plasmid) [Thermovibrio ammonificans HB-1]|uniref:Uncharacterized protein n=1 Tax=Thermovibrio ammonificans (strain DSM 15698 / JCM 12110 / HB-1) TaxID=648996 RepID=E8T6V4_THEA1|nr:hypothetical protein [Thermovibrio ammonificans]ADU97777.1 hypothetical protein Theam_1821 [Thermovibrio ammonificans HB-1]
MEAVEGRIYKCPKCGEFAVKVSWTISGENKKAKCESCGWVEYGYVEAYLDLEDYK